MAIESKLTSKGQITVPLKIREALKLGTGDRILWKLRADGKVELCKAATLSLKELVGILGKPRQRASLEDIDSAIRDRFRKEYK